MTNEAEIYFALYGDEFKPQDVTDLIGVTPTSITRKASPHPKHTKWQVSSGKLVADIIDVYTMSSTLIARLQPHTSKIVEAKQIFGLEAVLQVVLWISTDEAKSTPAIGFEQSSISFLHSVEASIDIDTYLNTSQG